jgi:hypothetical protein
MVFGGYAGGALDSGGRYDPVADVWTPTSEANAPSARNNHTMVWTGDRVIIWGGDDTHAPFSTGGRYDPAADSWTPTSDPYAPSPASGQSAVWTGNEVIVWGGTPLLSRSADTAGRYDPALDSWRPVSFVNSPESRAGHSTVWTGTQMIVWGGRSTVREANLSDGARYDPIADVWSPTATLGAPSARANQSGVWTGTLMLIWGGQISEGAPLDSGGLYDPATNNWFAMSSVNAPSARDGASAVWTGTRMIIWGGHGASSYAATGARYDPAANRWEPISIVNAPMPRSSHSTVWTGKGMIVWGGIGSSGQQMTGGIFDPVSDHWIPTSTIGAPLARIEHRAVWTGGRMIVWGGWNGINSLDTGGIYDPVADSWQVTSQVDAPGARRSHAAVWTGPMMFVWGGAASPPSATGGRFAYGQFADADCDGVVDNFPPAFCDDGNSCTTDVCGGSAGCLHPVRDNDGDGYSDSLCGGNDCDDLDPLRHPGAPERCNGLDDDCDGVMDEGGDLLCNDQDICTDVDACLGVLGCHHHARDFDGDGHGDSTCGGDDCTDANVNVWSPAIEVATLSASGAAPTTLAWTDQGPQVGPEILYLLVSGTITSPGTSGFGGAACLQVDVTATYQDSRPNPPTGTAYWYLTGAVNECGTGTYGTVQRDAELIATCY